MPVNRNMKGISRLLSDSYHMPGAFYSADKTIQPHQEWWCWSSTQSESWVYELRCWELSQGSRPYAAGDFLISGQHETKAEGRGLVTVLQFPKTRKLMAGLQATCMRADGLICNRAPTGPVKPCLFVRWLGCNRAHVLPHGDFLPPWAPGQHQLNQPNQRCYTACDSCVFARI